MRVDRNCRRAPAEMATNPTFLDSNGADGANHRLGLYFLVARPQKQGC